MLEAIPETLSFLWFPNWQEAVFTLGTFVFIAALLPSVFSKDKPAIQTSLMTGSVLSAFAVAYFTLGFIFAATTTSATVILWFTLAFQVKARNQREKKAAPPSDE